MSEKSWFAEWFNSPYYHLLYQHRSMDEADAFIPVLIEKLGIVPGNRVLDLACGKGRHARSFHAAGLQVTGLDLAPESIEEARKQSPADIRFEVGDMRTFALDEQFDLVANLFTSFGYFESEEDNHRVLQQIAKHLKRDGRLVIDFLNTNKVVANLVPESVQESGGVTFHITRRLEKGQIIKRIAFEDEGKNYAFEERVQALRPSDFEVMLSSNGFETVEAFGNYQMEPFRPESDRLILVAKLN